MGSGKTTLGKKLAAKLKMQFVDLDKAICERFEAVSIRKLIAEHGFEFFRKAECETLRGIDIEKKVIATGGGTPCFYNNMDWMLANGTVVFIEVDEKTIYNRLKDTDRNERPLLAGLDDDGLRSFIDGNLAERMPFYKRAQICFSPLKQNIEELAEQLS